MMSRVAQRPSTGDAWTAGADRASKTPRCPPRRACGVDLWRRSRRAGHACVTRSRKLSMSNDRDSNRSNETPRPPEGQADDTQYDSSWKPLLWILLPFILTLLYGIFAPG